MSRRRRDAWKPSHLCLPVRFEIIIVDILRQSFEERKDNVWLVGRHGECRISSRCSDPYISCLF